MAYDGFNPDGDPVAPLAVKLLIAGGFGVGKTTFVRAVTEIKSLHTEEYISQRGAQTDRLADVPDKQTTTVALDFGRITIDDEIVLYLFGMPGQERFWFMWNELGYGATGVVILADTRRLADCFAAIDYFEEHGTPFVVGVNCFEGALQYDPGDVRIALSLDPDVPVVLCDARRRDSVKRVLLTLVRHVLDLSPAEPDRQGAAALSAR